MPGTADSTLLSERRAFRLQQAAREAPVALGWMAFAVAVLSAGSLLTSFDDDWLPHLLHAGIVVLFAVAALLVRLGVFAPPLVPWVVALLSLAAVLSLEFEIARHPTTLGMGYVLIAMVAYAPFTFSMPAMLTVAGIMFAGWIAVANDVPGEQPTGWILAGAAALIVGLVSLRVRLQGFDETADALALNRQQATRDPLTGVLNRRGIEERMPELIALAERAESRVFVAFVDIDGLKKANDRFGHEFGDQLIVGVARSVQSSVRAADAVGRWGGDEFIVVGMGTGQDPDTMMSRILTTLRGREFVDERWESGVSVGIASAAPAPGVFESLLVQADHAMYERRMQERSGS